MALTYTPNGELGSLLPYFSLQSVEGELWTPERFKSVDAVLVMFICNHCPYVQALEDRLIDLGRRLQNRRVQILAICSNDPKDYPEDAPAELFKRWTQKQYPFPYLIDESQSAAKEFGAVCTPDFFVYNRARQLTYRGRLDDSWKNPQTVTRRELEEALEKTLLQLPPASPQNPSMGCSIKWKT